MSLLYSFETNKDGSYSFTSDQGNIFLIYFSESPMPDAAGNTHIIYNLGFSRDGDHSCVPFSSKYDERVRGTITSVINNFFEKNEHKAIIYFCFGDDGYSRHRKIVFNQWSKYLNDDIEKHDKVIPYEETTVYGSLMIVNSNPLKSLILGSFNRFLDDIYDSQK